MKKVLFICKQNENYGYSTTGKRSGLYNSTRFIADSLGPSAQVAEVHDNNDIDRTVAWLKPDVVIIEALWVVPDKFIVLKKLHPNVKWCVHLHSNSPFLALEGVAMKWIAEYSKLGVTVIVNSDAACHALSVVCSPVLLKNVYSGETSPIKPAEHDHITIGCFGAIRPMKNQLTQALAAIKFARSKNMKLAFYVNSGRSETGGDPVLKNLRELFANTSDAILCESKWLEHDSFMNLLKNCIDLALQVSLSETFNIVTADAVTAGVPVVTSSEVEWVSPSCQAPTDDVDAIVAVMQSVYRSSFEVRNNQRLLAKFSAASAKAWGKFINPPPPSKWDFWNAKT